MQGSIVKKGNKYYIVVDLPRTDGKRSQKWISGFRTRKEAERALVSTAASVHNNTYIDTSRVTVREFLALWLQHKSHTLSPATLSKYTHAANLFETLIDYQLPIQKVKPGNIIHFRDALLDRFEKPGTAATYFRSIRSAFEQALSWRYLSYNPFDGVDNIPARYAPMTILEPDDLVRLLEGIQDSTLLMPVVLAVLAGLRRGEACGLQWGDADLDAGIMSIRHNRIFADGEVYDREVKTPTSERTVALSAGTVDMMKLWCTRQKEYRLLHGINTPQNDYVCTKVDGEPINPNSLSKAFTRKLAALNLPPIRFHDLRHTHASLLLAAGESIVSIQKQLGHARPSITVDVYAHARKDAQKNLAEKMDLILASGKSLLEKELEEKDRGKKG